MEQTLKQGLFITMEGPDGSGKTTQINKMKEYLENLGFEVIVTREPGGTSISEQIRDVILSKENINMSYTAEMLLYAASRAQLVEEKIAPAVQQGKIVISDRFVDSSAVYQGIARGLGTEKVYNVNQYALEKCQPDITFFIDLDAEEGIKRKKDQKELDRMELETLEFHQMVAQGYRKLWKEFPERIYRIDGMASIEDIQNEIRQKIDSILACR